MRTAVADDLADSGLKAELSGVPVMQLEIRNAIERDRLIYNTLGFVAGCLIAVMFFRRVSFMIMAAARRSPPSCSRSARSAGSISGSTCSST